LTVIKMLKIIVKGLFYLSVGYFVYFASLFIPKNRNIWIFGSWFGQKFADNPKYLFLYVKKFHPEIRAIWLTNNKNVLSFFNNQNWEAYKINSLKGYISILRSNCIIISSGLSDVLGGISRFFKVRKVQLWHGTPLKKLESPDKGHNKKYKKYKKIYKFLLNKLFPFTKEADIIFATSEESKKSMALVFKTSKRNIFVTGYPRNDILFGKYPVKCDYLDNIRNKVNFKYVFAYLPTHRGEGKRKLDLFEKYGFDFNILQHSLETLNGIFIMKAHYCHKKLNLNIANKIPQRVYIPSDEELPDIYPLLKSVDILITDYSSVYFDFLLLNRPIIFTPFDIEEFTKNERELFYNYNDVTPGPKAKNWNEVLMYIKEAIENPKKYENERKKICKLFNTYNDANNSERVYRTIREIIK